MKKNYYLFSVIFALFLISNLHSQTYWTGPITTFSKANYADWTLPANQDQLTANVAITRADNQGLFNIVTETSYSNIVSPADTEWAFGTIADDVTTLTFDTWNNTMSGCPPCQVGNDMVLHLITDDIYIDIKYLSWTQNGQGGGFSYQRSNPVCTVFPPAPTVSSPVIYNQFETATALTATSGGDSLLWYTMSAGGTGSNAAPTPSTSTPGSTSYWVSSINNNGCESTTRSEIVVTVNPAATHLNFDGIDDFVDISSPYTSFINEVSVEFWINRTGDLTTGSGIGQATSEVDDMSTNVWLVHGNSDNTFTFYVNDGGIWKASGSSSIIPLNSWTHISAVADASGVRIYIDGVLDVESTNGITTSIQSNPSASLHIGKDVRFVTNSGRNFQGNIDDVRIWNIARSQSQIDNTRSCELNGDETGLVAYYNFNQGEDAGNNSTVTSLIDNSTNSNDGVLNNFALTGNASNWISGSPLTIGATIPQTTDYTICEGDTVSGGLISSTISASSSITTFSGDTTGAPTYDRPTSMDQGDSCSDNNDTPVNYNTFTLTVPSDGSYDFTMCGDASWDTFLALYEAPFDPNSGCTGNNLIVANDDDCSVQSTITANLVAGTNYVLVVSGYDDSEYGSYIVTASQPVTSVVESVEWYTSASGGTLIGTGSPFNPVGVAGSGITDTNTPGSTSFWAQFPGGLCRSEAIFTVLDAPTLPTVTTPIVYNVGDTASQLTASNGGDTQLWYTSQTGGTGDTNAPTPSTASPGLTSYWVSNANNNGCETDRVEIVVEVNSSTPGTHLNFDGDFDYVDCGNTASLQITGNTITLESMVKFNTFKSFPNDGNIINKEQNGAGSDFGYMLRAGGSGIINFNCGSGSWNELNTPSNTVQLGIWYHIAATYDGTTMKIFVDGVEVASRTVTFSIGNSNRNMIIGDWSNTGRNIDAEIDEVRIWNITRTGTEIDESRSCELDGNETGLVAYYQFNQGFDSSNNTTIATLVDTTANGNDGILNGFDLAGSSSNFITGSPITSGNSCSLLSTSDVDLSNSISLYPNPSRDEVVVKLNNLTDTSVEVYDLNGRIVLNEKLVLAVNKLNISNFETGLYIFKFKTQRGELNIKVVKN